MRTLIIFRGAGMMVYWSGSGFVTLVGMVWNERWLTLLCL
jgi:hypothetical protein